MVRGSSDLRCAIFLRGTNSPRSRMSRDPTAHEQRRCRRARAAPWMPVMSKRDPKDPKKPTRDAPSDAHERAKSSSIVLASDYRPSEDEPFMNERQRTYFRQKLLAWKEEIIRQTRDARGPARGLDPARRPRRPRHLRDRPRAERARATVSASSWPRSTRRSPASRTARTATARRRASRSASSGRRTPDRHPLARAQERHERRERVLREERVARSSARATARAPRPPTDQRRCPR